MIVAVKCNITSLALKKVSELYWGTKYKDVDDIILENYIESLNCGNIVICHDSDCTNSTIIFNCILAVAAINSTTYQNTITFSILNTDLTGGLAPFQYNWDFEDDDFDLSSPIDTSQLVLTLKVGKSFGSLVSIVSVMVTDANDCIFIKHCYITPTGMQCSDSYIACPNVSGLMVVNKFVRCFNTSGLVVTKKV